MSIGSRNCWPRIHELRLHPEALLRTFHRRNVHYVLIGAFTAAFHGSPLPEAESLFRRVGLLSDFWSLA